MGEIQSFIQYVRQFTQPISQVAQVSNMLQSTAAAAERVFEFLEEEEEEISVQHPLKAGAMEGDCMHGARHRYRHISKISHKPHNGLHHSGQKL